MTLVVMCAVYRGKVIGNPLIRKIEGDRVPDAQLGALMHHAMMDARKLGYTFNDPDMFMRVEYKVLP